MKNPTIGKNAASQHAAPETETTFDYDTAFGRNLGIITPEEQQRLRNSRAALAGVGGVGSFYAHALARMGVGHFSIADGDDYSVANFNRQMGGNMDTVGVNKAQAVARQILRINPQADVKVFDRNLDRNNLDEFLSDANIVLDAVEMFNVEDNRLLFRMAREHGLPVLMAAPFGFSTVFVAIDPNGMSADEYFDWHDEQDFEAKICSFVLGLAPGFLQLKELDLRFVDLKKHTGPSHVGACLLCAGVVATETTRLLLDRAGTRFAPKFLQFNPYSFRFTLGHIRGGNRSLIQQWRRSVLLKRWHKIHPPAVRQTALAENA